MSCSLPVGLPLCWRELELWRNVITIPAETVPGTYFLIAKADGDLVVVEGQEGNNTGARVVQVTASP